MKLQFLLEKVKRDLNLAPRIRSDVDGKEKINLDDAVRILERWEQALINEAQLTAEAERFEMILTKEGQLTRPEIAEAFQLLMMVHMPLIRGQNDIMGIRLKDADYFHLNNKILGLPLNEGLDDYDDAVEALAEAHRKEAKRKKEEEAKRRKLKKEAEQERKMKEKQELVKAVKEELSNDILL